MRFLRMLTNSLLAGALGAAYLTVIVLQLNREVPLLSLTTWRWFVTLGAFYGVHLAVAFYVLMVAREFFSLDVMSPGWASVRILAWLSAVVAAIAATLMWLNVRGLATALDDVAVRRMTAGAFATGASAVALLGIAIAHYSSNRRGSRVGAALFVIAAFGSLALPLAARGPTVPDASSSSTTAPTARLQRPPGPRVVMLLLDGASLEYVWTRIAEGRLANFARLLENGASIDLATIRPTQPDPVWAAAATGMYPFKNGVRSAAAYYARNDGRPIHLLPDHCFSHALVHLGIIRHQPNSSDAWVARPLWSILADGGVPVGIVRWPLTYPVHRVAGFMVSDRFHDLLGSMYEFDDSVAYPDAVVPVARAAFAQADAPGGPAGADLAPASPEASALRKDRLYSRAMTELRARADAQFLALRFQGLDTIGHRSWRYAEARSGSVPAVEDRRQAQALDKAYAYVDSEIGAAVDTLAPGDLLLVVSGFGMQPLNPLKQAIGRLLGDPDISGTHERAPDGFLLAYGSAVERGRRPRGSIVDVAPTVLYYLGFPVGRDMDGYARTDLFTEDFTGERPIAFIPTYNR
jgi:predicted AlkP superfamily phosphohydrolase/phosphomutase